MIVQKSSWFLLSNAQKNRLTITRNTGCTGANVCDKCRGDPQMRGSE